MAKKKELVGRIRYYKGEYIKGSPYDEWYIFENRWEGDCEDDDWSEEDDEEWGLEVAFPLVDDNVHYTALTQIRKWQQLGISFYFA